jgi:hypothetical protein
MILRLARSKHSAPLAKEEGLNVSDHFLGAQLLLLVSDNACPLDCGYRSLRLPPPTWRDISAQPAASKRNTSCSIRRYVRHLM